MTTNIPALSLKVLTATGSLIIAASLHAHPETLDETTILATGFAIGKTETGLRVNVDDAKDLNDIGIWRLSDAVLFSPGVNIFSNGQQGASSSIFTRGTESDHTAIFVDGVKLTHSRVFPFPASNILSGAGIQPGNRIELLRGPQSALYGSDAIGGVLSLSLEKGSDHGRNRAWLELGSFESINSGISFQGQEGKLSYNTFLSWQQTANDRSNNDYESFHAGLRLDYALTENTTLGATLRVLDFETELPPLGFTPFALNETKNTIYSVYLESQMNEKWFTRLSIGGYRSEFENIGGFGDSKVETDYDTLEWKNQFRWNQNHETTAGVSIGWLDTLNSGALIQKTERNESYYFQHRWYQKDLFSLLAGVRYDHYDGGEDSTTFRIAGNYQYSEQARFHASVASAFRRPSVVDLYGFGGFGGGNLDLQSEESLGWDAGVTFDISEKTSLDVTYFHNDIDNLITSVAPTFTAMNIQKARTRGVEVSYKASFLDEKINTRLSYTWLQAKNLSDGTRLLRRPTHTLNADINGRVSDKLLVGLGVTWVADREDIDASTYARIDAKDYIVTRIYGRYQLNDSITLNARVENLFNKQYSEVDGFPARGLGAFAGITFEW